ncbi:hypothetical protein N7494_002984 [Penicillium frequentans]|uniref:Uncharacterized protein n=1 Tax=Penicillium frequentans TaxID=3151616 RepID=A0AAD6D4N2_9EURO|nr:hypothetical protein N7494_002984 [Penicillium glabrum]
MEIPPITGPMINLTRQLLQIAPPTPKPSGQTPAMFWNVESALAYHINSHTVLDRHPSAQSGTGMLHTCLLTGAHENFDTPPPPSMTQKFIHSPFRLDQDIEERANRVSVQHHRHSSRFPPSQYS